MYRTYFPIFCVGRSGSTSLVNLLRSFKNCYCFGEVFHGWNHGLKSSQKPLDYLRDKFKKKDCSYVGAKLIISYLSQKNLIDIGNSDVSSKPIFLYRKNTLNGVISGWLANYTNNWGDYRSELRGSIRIPINKLKCLYNKRLEHNRKLSFIYENISNGKMITYEDLLVEEKLKDLLSYIGVPYTGKVSLPGIKIANPSLRDKITNIEEIEDFFKEEYLI